MQHDGAPRRWGGPREGQQQLKRAGPDSAGTRSAWESLGPQPAPLSNRTNGSYLSGLGTTAVLSCGSPGSTDQGGGPLLTGSQGDHNPCWNDSVSTTHAVHLQPQPRSHRRGGPSLGSKSVQAAVPSRLSGQGRHSCGGSREGKARPGPCAPQRAPKGGAFCVLGPHG